MRSLRIMSENDDRTAEWFRAVDKPADSVEVVGEGVEGAGEAEAAAEAAAAAEATAAAAAKTAVIPVNYILSGSLCAVDHPRFLPAIRSTHDASSLDQIKHGLKIVHASGLNFACQLTSNV